MSYYSSWYDMSLYWIVSCHFIGGVLKSIRSSQGTRCRASEVKVDECRLYQLVFGGWPCVAKTQRRQARWQASEADTPNAGSRGPRQGELVARRSRSGLRSLALDKRSTNDAPCSSGTLSLLLRPGDRPQGSARDLSFRWRGGRRMSPVAQEEPLV